MIQYIVWCMHVVFPFPRKKRVHNFFVRYLFGFVGCLLPAELPRSVVFVDSVV